MENFVFTREDIVFINSNLSEEMYAKTKASLLMDLTGYIVKAGTEDSFSFSEWKFSEAETINDTVYYKGNGFSGTSVYNLIQNKTQEAKTILFTLCKIIDFAINNKINLCCNGLNGILYNGKDFLFLPEELYNRCCLNQGKEEFNNLQNQWKDSSLEGSNALRFQLGILSYFAVSFKLPFPYTNQEEHSSNLANKNFLPLEYQINGINKTVCKEINSLLQKSESNHILDKALLKEAIFSPATPVLSEEDFLQQAKKYWNKRQAKLSILRKLNRIKVKLIISFVAVIFVVISALIIISEQNKKPCTVGLTSTQVTEMFYTGLHTMNPELLIVTAKNCPQAQEYISKVPQISITSLMRGAYNFDSGISTPENILFFEPGSSKFYSHNIYGLTNFKIDSIDYTLHSTFPTNKKHPRKLSEENGQKLFYKANSLHRVEYYHVHTVDLMIIVEKVQADVNLTWIEDRWHITELREKVVSTQTIDPKEFSDQLMQAINFSGGKMEYVVQFLKSIYDWIPTVDCVLQEKDRLDRIGY